MKVRMFKGGSPKGSCWLAPLLVFVQVAGALASETEPRPALSDRHPVRASLLADVLTASVGEPFQLALRLELAPGWHVYWTYPGNTGKPTRARILHDPRYTAGDDPRFPAPEVFRGRTLDELSFGYSDEVLIPAEVVVVDPPPGAELTLQAEVSWLACKGACVDGRATPSLKLAVGDSVLASPEAATIAAAVAALPAALPSERAWLEAFSRTDEGGVRMRYRVAGLAAIERFVPRWAVGGACKVREHRIQPDGPSRFILEQVLE